MLFRSNKPNEGTHVQPSDPMSHPKPPVLLPKPSHVEQAIARNEQEFSALISREIELEDDIDRLSRELADIRIVKHSVAAAREMLDGKTYIHSAVADLDHMFDDFSLEDHIANTVLADPTLYGEPDSLATELMEEETK